MLSPDLAARPAPKPPRQVLDSVYAFPPNRDTLGGTAYLIVENSTQSSAADPVTHSAAANLLVDCPAWTPEYVSFIGDRGGIRWLLITHRGGYSHVKDWQTHFGCSVVVQEQAAYLHPDIALNTDLIPFQTAYRFDATRRALWTPGHSPGSACLYYQRHGGVLFTGRHLLPIRSGQIAPLRQSKTFHWPRQLRSVERLLDEFSPDTLAHICPGASTGFLRGSPTVENAYAQLQAIDLDACRTAQPML